MALNGNKVIIYMDGTAIASCRSTEIQTECGLIEVASATEQVWQNFLAGRKTWAVNVGFLILANTDVQKLLQVGQTVTLKFKDRNSADSTGVSGTAIIRTCRITSTQGNLVQGAFSFQGSGALAAPST